MKTFSPVVFLGLLFLIVGCTEETETGNKEVYVTVKVLEPATISETLNIPCRLEAGSEAVISLAMPGVIEKVLVAPGDSVVAGQSLLALSTDDIQRSKVSESAAMLCAAEAATKYASNNLERGVNLLDAGAISPGEFDRITAEARTAEAVHDQALAGYNASLAGAMNRFINAPFAGVIGRVVVTEGNTAVGTLLSISNSEIIISELLVAPEHLHKLRAGLQVAFSTDHFPGVLFPGYVTSVADAGDAVSGLVAISVQLNDTTKTLVPGLSGISILSLTTVDSAIVLPATMMTSVGDDLWEVAVIKNGKAEILEVSTGIRSGNSYEITEGLVFGDSVISLGHTLVSDGIVIRVVE